MQHIASMPQICSNNLWQSVSISIYLFHFFMTNDEKSLTSDFPLIFQYPWQPYTTLFSTYSSYAHILICSHLVLHLDIPAFIQCDAALRLVLDGISSSGMLLLLQHPAPPHPQQQIGNLVEQSFITI